MLILVLVIGLAVLLTRQTLLNIDANEAEKRDSVTRFVTNAVEQGSSGAQIAVLAAAANQDYMTLFAAKDRQALLNATHGLFDKLKRDHGIRQFQFTGSDFKVFLRVHNPEVYGDDVTTTRPTLVECITQKHLVYGLEQGRSGYGFRAVVPAYNNGAFLGCIELGSDLDVDFLKTLNANYQGKWAVVNLEKGLNLVSDTSLLASLNEPPDSAILNPNFSTPGPVLNSVRESKPYYQYNSGSEEMALYIPLRNFKGDVALYVRFVSHTPYYSTVRSMVMKAVIISIAGLLLTGLVFSVLYRGIKNPVQKLVVETEKIKNFDLKDEVKIDASLTELETLITAVADMKIGLQSFQKYVPSNLVRQLIDTHQEAKIGGKLKELTVFFSDIANFTSITENLPPNELTIQLSEYFNEVTNTILDHKGTVDKYIGDAVMAFWGAPVDMEDHAVIACRAALECRRRLEALSRKWKAEGKYEFHTRIGLSTGEIVVGNIGSDQRLNYTVIGDPVNLASRLEGLNKEYRTSIIISEATYEKCRKYVEVRLLDFVAVKGKSDPVRIYELIGERGDISPRQKESLSMFAQAMELYISRDWDEALVLLRKLLTREPADFVTQLYIDRCVRFKAQPPDAEWVGQYIYTTK